MQAELPTRAEFLAQVCIPAMWGDTGCRLQEIVSPFRRRGTRAGQIKLCLLMSARGTGPRTSPWQWIRLDGDLMCMLRPEMADTLTHGRYLSYLAAATILHRDISTSNPSQSQGSTELSVVTIVAGIALRDPRAAMSFPLLILGETEANPRRHPVFIPNTRGLSSFSTGFAG